MCGILSLQTSEDEYPYVVLLCMWSVVVSWPRIATLAPDIWKNAVSGKTGIRLLVCLPCANCMLPNFGTWIDLIPDVCDISTDVEVRL